MLSILIKDILPVVIILSLLYIANKYLNIKQILRSKFISDDSYRVTIALILVFIMMIHGFISIEPFMSNPLGAAIFFSFLYLANISN